MYMKDKANKIIQMDCLEYLKSLPDGCVDLCLIDPPYNISHAKWDKWKCQKEYVNWLGSVFLQCQRVLKDNGSFYFWHNDFKQMVELQHWISQNTRFVFNSMISWVKPNFRPIAWKNKQDASNLRTWFNIQEYCLYYTFQDGKIISMDDYNRVGCFLTIKKYMWDEREKLKLTERELFLLIHGYNTKRSKMHYWNKLSQWQFPTKRVYKKLQTTGFFQKPYEELRAEYKELRPRFNIQNGHAYNNVWYSKEDNGNKTSRNGKLHTCEKPQDLLQKIILTSSN